ncbi:lytic transglycosylase domain-containing protein [Sphingomonas sp. SUN039]|uniref:lytic transglycosylase domain-containing protein n=1 Tax=Sphingomonas sp. SUN039 TaxID=2937787 RepID=UPI0021641E54|nr:lytic transglycosylase domain-containing protein [Sphingomonas sp. SUN039]UVO53883.1 lytic transglycosylase domain-containing protein [Sphingomonas sp. SUN039]
MRVSVLLTGVALSGATVATPVIAAEAIIAAKSAALALPVQLGPNARSQYRAIFDDIDAGRWTDAAAKLDFMPEGPLHFVARAAIFTAKGSPKVDGTQLAALATAAPQLPEAPTLVRLAQSRGVDALPALPEPHAIGWLGTSPRRGRTATTEGDAVASVMGQRILQFIKDDSPTEAEALLVSNEPSLTPAGLAEWRQRVAWSYYIEDDDTNARRLATVAQAGTGPWAAQADWVVGLAAWRQKDWTTASNAFASLARRSYDPEMIAAGHYWAARADMVRHQPDLIQPRLRAAARLEETFYGMLASGAMGLAARKDDDGSGAIRQLTGHPNVRAALALAEIGENDRADALVRWQARIGSPAEHATLTAIAGKLDLPSTQLWLAHNGPAGAKTSIEGRYPMPGNWSPEGGWRVDRALVFAHTLQESNFRTNAVSAAGARGLMQVRPGTASDIARKKGIVFAGSLSSPATNMEYGQSYIEQLRDMAQTGGLLPKVIAAYNAGPAPLDRWNSNTAAAKDPLLYIESIPYWETRGYVTIVLRNYWMYQQQAGQKTVSRSALVQGIWPKFPTVASAAR